MRLLIVLLSILWLNSAAARVVDKNSASYFQQGNTFVYAWVSIDPEYVDYLVIAQQMSADQVAYQNKNIRDAFNRLLGSLVQSGDVVLSRKGMLIHGPNVLVKMDQRAYEQLAQSRIVIALKVWVMNTPKS